MQCIILTSILNNHNHNNIIIIIYAEPIGCNEGETRLADGGFSQRGRVEQCVNGVWGTVCDNKWDHTDAVTLCKTLGYPGTGNVWIVDNNNAKCIID